jgi:hypothetical protein
MIMFHASGTGTLHQWHCDALQAATGSYVYFVWLWLRLFQSIQGLLLEMRDSGPVKSLGASMPV